MATTLTGAEDGLRCHWCRTVPELCAYHDHECGFPVQDDHRLFEQLSLEGFQSGLSWHTILAKRGNFRQCFHAFHFNQIAGFTAFDVVRLLKRQEHCPASRNNRLCAESG